MIIRCAACRENLGDTINVTVDQALAGHVCLASPEERDAAITRLQFEQIINENGMN